MPRPSARRIVGLSTASGRLTVNPYANPQYRSAALTCPALRVYGHGVAVGVAVGRHKMLLQPEGVLAGVRDGRELLAPPIRENLRAC